MGEEKRTFVKTVERRLKECMKYLFFIIRILFACVGLMAGKAFAESPFVVFSPVDATQGLSGNQVRNITQLQDGRMMITTAGQFNLYDGTGFDYLHYDARHICRLSDYAGFHHSYTDAAGRVWMKNQQVLMVVDGRTGQMLEHPDSLFGKWGIREPLKDFFMDTGKNFWLLTESDCLMRVAGQALQAEPFLLHVSALTGGQKDVLYDLEVVDDHLYLFYRSGILLCYDLHTRDEVCRRSLGEVLSEGWYGNTSYMLASAGGLYQLCNGVHGGALLYYDCRRQMWTEVLRADYWLNYIALDCEGNIWLSCREGLWFIGADLQEKHYIPVLKLVDGRRIETEVSTVYNDAQGGLWVGTLNRGVLYYHPARFRFRNVGRTLFPVPGDEALQVTGFHETDNRQILVETTEGMFRYDPADAVSPLKKMDIPILKKELGSLVQGGPAILQEMPLGKDSLVGITIEGLFVRNRQGRVLSYIPSLHPCNALCVDGRGDVWIGREDGLVLWNPSTGRRRTFYTTDGLVNNAVQSIIETSDSTLWVSTANGLSCLTVRPADDGTWRYVFVNFNQDDGIIGNEFCPRSVFRTSDGTLYWGGINGFNVMGASHSVAAPSPFVPVFVGFSLFGQKHPLPSSGEVALAYDQNFFSLEFSALNYVNPTQTHYRYILVGIDAEEQEMCSSDGRGYVTYTDLPPGSYRFKVQATRGGEPWTGRYAEFGVIIRPPFWRTPYAYGLYVCLGVGLTWLLAVSYARRKRRSLVREQKEKLDEMKGVFLKNIHSELQEPVDRILSPLDSVLVSLGEGEVRQQLQGVRQEAEEMKKLIDQLAEGVLLPLPADEKSIDLESLLMDMRHLLVLQEERKLHPRAVQSQKEAGPLLTAADEAFVRKALQCVESNLDNPGYSVEAWSRDMGMDRTRLYRKLTSLVGKTPTGFIRSVRLKQAACLLDKGYTVAEVADMVGFSTSSYLSKCFQEEFGVRPSQYAQRKEKH